MSSLLRLPPSRVAYFLLCEVNVTEYKFVCLTHSEAKQTKTSEFGAEKGLLQDQARRTGDLCSKTLNFPVVFRQKLFVCFLFFSFCLCHVACGILVPQPGIEPVPAALEAWSPNHWATREVPQGEVFIGKIWSEGCRVCDFLLIGCWWGNRVMLQESCAQPEVAILHLGGGLSSWRIYCYVHPLRRNQDPVLILCYSFLIVPPLFLHSLFP